MLVHLAGRAYLPELIPTGVRVFRYSDGFLHQKVILIDDDLATIGTANLDNRSMRLNFELTLVFAGTAFAAEVAAMLRKDFKHATEIDTVSITAEAWWLRAASRGARLLAPVL
jgi:cardiolipin synthase